MCDLGYWPCGSTWLLMEIIKINLFVNEAHIPCWAMDSSRHHCKKKNTPWKKLAMVGEHNFVCDWGHLPCTAIESSAEDMLLVENSRSLSFLAAFWAFLRFFWLGLSPHRLVPPYMLGIFRSAIPSNLGPLARSKAYPSHWQKKKSTKLSLD